MRLRWCPHCHRYTYEEICNLCSSFTVESDHAGSCERCHTEPATTEIEIENGPMYRLCDCCLSDFFSFMRYDKS